LAKHDVDVWKGNGVAAAIAPDLIKKADEIIAGIK